MIRVRPQIADHPVPADPLPFAAGDREAGQVRQPPDGVQVEPVVVLPPAVAHRRRSIDDQGLDSSPAEHRSGCQPRGTGSDDQGPVPLGHGGTLVLASMDGDER
jgi:hypothetical protein